MKQYLIDIQKAVQKGNLFWSKHSLKEMNDDNLISSQVKEAIINGEIIEKYPNDKPFSSILVFGYSIDVPIHVVVAFNHILNEAVIITVYIPNTKIFEENLKTRRKK